MHLHTLMQDLLGIQMRVRCAAANPSCAVIRMLCVPRQALCLPYRVVNIV
jgi:hypothetical protein